MAILALQFFRQALDCKDNYDSAVADCKQQYDDPDDADDLEQCIQSACAFEARIIVAYFFQESRRIQWFNGEQRQIHRPAIFHAVAISGVLALRRSFGLVDTVPARNIQVSQLNLFRGLDCSEICQSSDNCGAERSGDFHLLDIWTRSLLNKSRVLRRLPLLDFRLATTGNETLQLLCYSGPAGLYRQT